MTERITELVNGELDGTNSSSESTELAGVLDEDDTAKAFFEQTKALFGVLDTIPHVDPPAELKQRIMETIGREAGAASASTTGIMTLIQNFFQPILSRPAWAMSYAFVAGILVGVAVLNLPGSGDVPENQVVQGTMGQADSRILDEARLQVGGLSVHLAAVGLDNEVVLDVTITGAGDSTVHIQTTNDSLEGTTITASGAGHFTVSLDEMVDLLVTVTSSGQEASVRLLISPP